MSLIPTQPLSVQAMLASLSDLLTQRFERLLVRGEISGWTRAASGHCYFTLKDEHAQVRCVMFRQRALLLRERPGDGAVVDVRGALTLYPPRGDLQLQVEWLTLAGRGALHERFLMLRDKLQAEGLFDEALKRPLPPYPACVGVITSPQAAALQDVLAAFARRAPHVRLLIYPASVQGAQAPRELMQALSLANRHAEAEVLLLVRGGGSAEDLDAFNDEALARAIRASRLPVVSGVGHESDISISDFVADRRAATPTAAAELVAPPRDDLLRHLDGIETHLRRTLRRGLDIPAQRLDRATLVLRSPRVRLTMQHERLHEWQRRLNAAHARLQQQGQHRLATLHAQLEALGPQATLARGFVIATNAEGTILRTPQTLASQPDFTLHFAQGRAKVKPAEVGVE